jgi:hypothetical protein
MVLAAAQHDELVLRTEDIELALATLADAEVKMPKAFANVGKNILSPDVDSVGEAIMAAGQEGISLGVLGMRFKHSLRRSELLEVLDTLLESKHVIFGGTPPRYFPNYE